MEEALRLESMRSQARLSDFTFTFLSNDLKVHLLCHKCHGFLLCTAICHHCVCMCVYTQFTFKQCGSWEADTTTAPPAFKILHRPVNSSLVSAVLPLQIQPNLGHCITGVCVYRKERCVSELT